MEKYVCDVCGEEFEDYIDYYEHVCSHINN